MSEFRSQDHVGQDQWVDEVLGQMTNGTFLDVGCGDCELINNTYFFETNRNWRGVGIDIKPIHEQGWLCRRKRSRFVCGDARKVDYKAILDTCGMPAIIDYLSIDLEPPQHSLIALHRVFESDRKFRVITYETDVYRQQETQKPSREFLSSLGYTLAREGRQDDFWVNEKLLDN